LPLTSHAHQILRLARVLSLVCLLLVTEACDSPKVTQDKQVATHTILPTIATPSRGALSHPTSSPIIQVAALASGTPCPYQDPLQVLSRPDFPVPLEPPIFPGALEVQATTLPEVYEDPPGEPFFGYGDSGVGTKKITFKTHDDVEVVLRSYRETLQKDGWSLSADYARAPELRFSWNATADMFAKLPCPPTPPCCQPVWKVRVIVRNTQGINEFEIREGYIPGL
jgi:hypothetical protein